MDNGGNKVAGIVGNTVGGVMVVGNIANLADAGKGSNYSHIPVVNLLWLVSLQTIVCY